ncbi:enoyl-CoA hydratase, partial [Usnea florida]
PPPPTAFTRLAYPAPHVLLVTLCRPRQLNCINSAGHDELHHIWSWLDKEPSLRIGIVTGEGRAFCAGADLKEWDRQQSSTLRPNRSLKSSGFGGLSRRRGKKPVIAAVNGIAHGGGCEMIANCDIVLASPSAVFALPEVKRGVVAIAGALPRLARAIGRMRAMEMALSGRNVSAEEAKSWGLCNAVSDKDGDGLVVEGGVVQLAVQWADEIGKHSPDSVVVSKEGVELGWDGVGVEEGSQTLIDGLWKRMEGGENMMEGVRAFVEKRNARWVD